MSTDEPQTPARSRDRRETARQVGAMVVGGLIVAFAALNRDDIEVNWIFATATTPLIVVIAVAFVLGAVVGLLVARSRSRARR